MELAFIGLGRMGAGMARNLARAGHRVTLYNRTRDKTEALAAAEGCAVANSVADAVRGCDAAITMLADDTAAEQIVLGSNRNQSIADALPPGAVHISCSTISTRLAQRLATEHDARNQQYLSAPVFGRPEAAEAKKLLVVVAGPSGSIDRCRPVFDSIGRQTFVAGPEPWQANAVKLYGNLMIASMIQAFGEANATLRKARVDPHMFLDVMNALFASPVYANYGRIIADESFEPAGFPLRLGLKDIRLALDTALECQSPMPVASIIRDQFLSAMANGQGELDWCSVVRSAARNAGLL